MVKKNVSKRMRAVRSKWTKPEKIIHGYLKSIKIKHKMHPKMFANPDIKIKDSKTLIFYNSCFWHKCPKCWNNLSKLNDYWKGRLYKNYKRDKRNYKTLQKEGWKVVILWGHELKKDSFKKILMEKLK